MQCPLRVNVNLMSFYASHINMDHVSEHYESPAKDQTAFSSFKKTAHELGFFRELEF